MGIDKLEPICADQVNWKENDKLRGNRNAWTCLSQSMWDIDKLEGVWGERKG